MAVFLYIMCTFANVNYYITNNKNAYEKSFISNDIPYAEHYRNTGTRNFWFEKW